MAAPEEIVAVPLTLWLAEVATAFPDVDETPGVGWGKLGAEGANNYDDAGVDFDHSETVNDVIPAGSTMAVKRFRVGEAFKFNVNLMDVSPTQYAKVMNNATVTDTAAGAGTPGKSAFSLFRGTNVAQFAVLARGESSVDNDLNLQFRISKAFVSVNGVVKWNKGVPAVLPVEILAIRHSESDVIDCEIQTAEAS